MLTILFYTFSLIIGVCLSTNAMEEKTLERPTRLTSLPTQFTSPEEMRAYGERIMEAFRNQDYGLIIILGTNKPARRFNSTHSDVEDYLFNRTFVLAKAYEAQEKELQLNPQATIQYYIKAIKEINAYLSEYGTFKSEVQTFNDRMVTHRFHILELAGDAYFKIATLKNTPNYKIEQFISSLNNAIDAYEQSVRYCYKVFDLPEVWKPLQDMFRNESLPKIQLSLASAYCSLASACPSEAPSHIKKARNIYAQGKKEKWDEVQLGGILSTISTAEIFLEKNKKPRVAQNSKKIGAKRQQNDANTNLQVLNKVDNIQNDVGRGQLLGYEIQRKYLSIANFISSNVEEYGQNSTRIKEGLEDIEETIAGQLNLDTSVERPENDLEAIYEHLPALLTMKTMQLFSAEFIPAFILNGDIEGAVLRANLFKKLEIKHNGEASLITRFIAAATKNLLGDHEEWLILNAEFASEVAKKRKKKKAQKAKNEKTIVEALKYSQQQTEKNTLALSKINNENTPKIKESSTEKAEAEAAHPEKVLVSDMQRKLEKQQRHEEAQAKRQQDIENSKDKENDQNFTQPEINGEKPSKDDALEKVLTSSNISLRDLYELSHKGSKVEDEIENNNWQFTRNEFLIYLENLECVCKPGNGIHIHASLPKATHVMQGDNVITILNDFGGALTLPSWDKDYVPNYLKPQILKARDKLRALKIKALHPENNV